MSQKDTIIADLETACRLHKAAEAEAQRKIKRLTAQPSTSEVMIADTACERYGMEGALGGFIRGRLVIESDALLAARNKDRTND